MSRSRSTRPGGVGDPVYLRVAEGLREYLVRESLVPGDVVPPEAALTTEFGVSRVTLRRAVEVLVREGVLVRRQGVGTFVAAPRLSAPLIGLHSTREICRANEFRHDVQIVEMEQAAASAAEADQLGLAAGDPLLRFTRLDLIGGSPTAVAECALPYQLMADVSREDLQESSTYELIEDRHKIFLTSARQSIRAEEASGKVADLLAVPAGSPVLVLQRVTFDVAGRAVELGKVSYRHDRMEWTVELTRQLGGQEETQTGILLRYQPA